MTGSALRGTVWCQADRLVIRGRSGGGKGSRFCGNGGWRIFLEGQNGAKTAPRRPKTRQDVPRCAKMRPRGPQDGPRRLQDAPRCPQDAPGPGKWRQNGGKLAPKSHPKSMSGGGLGGSLGCCFTCFLKLLAGFTGGLGTYLGHLGGILGRLGRKKWPTWLQLGSQNGAQMDKKSMQKFNEILMPFGIDF